MIAFDFDRAKMRRRLIIHSAIALGYISVVLSLSHIAGKGWAGLAVLALAYASLPYFFDSMRWVGVLVRGLRRADEAVRVNRDGLVDNASEYALGLLTWDEIEKIYPFDWKFRLLTDRWGKMPVISQQRGMVVVVKDGADLQHLLLKKPRIVRLLSKQWCASGRGRWLFIPEMELGVSADELMRQLNSFYVAEVRGAA